MNSQESCCLICVKELLETHVSVFSAVGWFECKVGHSRLRESFFAATELPEQFEVSFGSDEESNSF